MTILIALIGEQQLPNYLAARYYQPDVVLSVYSEKTEPQYKNLQKMLQHNGISVDGIKTDPYDLATIGKAINDKLATMVGVSAQSLIVNLTGGTKIMSLAAYQVAVQWNAPVIYLQSEKGKSILDYYSWQDHQLYHHKPAKELPEYLTLKDMLDLHLGDKWDRKRKEPNDIGYLFELAIGQTLQNHGYEITYGISDKKKQIDIDVMARQKNHIMIVEAKTKGGKTDHSFEGIKQLSTGMRYLGGTYTYPFLITNYVLPEDAQRNCELLRIHSVLLSHYQQRMDALPQEDIDTLLTAIRQAMMLENQAEKK